MKNSLWIVVASMLLIAGPFYAQDKGFGIGIIAGEPTGISLKNWLSRTEAIDAAAAWSFEGESNLHIHADYLLHNFDVFNVQKGQLPLYYGIGGRIKFSDRTQVGVRGVVGIDYLLENAPLDIFLEIVPILELAPSTDLKFNGAIGLRFFF